VLSQATRGLEFSVHCLSTTADGYKTRSRTTVAAVKQLAAVQTWSSAGDEEFEEAHVVIGTLKGLCHSVKRVVA
jgi:hypothetical protein